MDTDVTRRRPSDGSGNRCREREPIEATASTDHDDWRALGAAAVDRHASTELWAYRLQIAALRGRIDDLERELEARRRRERAIVDRYERLLADRTATAERDRERGNGWGRGRDGLVSRLLDRLDGGRL